ncbi:MAG: ATPase, T2SS/T4P/T4SS family [Desulfobacterales bacterium]
MAKIDAFFKLMHEQGASDLHLTASQPPSLRIRGDIERIKYKVLDNDDLRGMLYEITPEEKIKVFEETGDVDFGYEIPGLARYRANFFMQKNGVGAVFREIPTAIMTAEQLGLPPVISKLATLPRGLVLVTGPTGSGKSTTLASIIDVANIGIHTHSFASALRGALREDPDIILVGEMRDLETISLAIEAASTGHLVFATLHTTSAVKTVDRIIEVFPSDQQAQVRSTLADGMRAIIAQVLFKRIDKKSRCVALEILIANSAVRNLIREAKTHQLPSMIQTGKKYGMQLLDDAIMDLYKRGWISADEAYIKANEKAKFRPLLTSPPTDFTEV